MGRRMNVKAIVVIAASSVLTTVLAQTTLEPAKILGVPVQQRRAEILCTKVLCKEPGRYIGWPSVCTRKNGEILAVFSGDRDAHVCPWGKVQMVGSTDMGETWSKPQTVCNTPLDDRDCITFESKANIQLAVLKPGWFAVFFPPKGGHSPGCLVPGCARKIRKVVVKIRV